ncbi:hypothetical protein ACOSQ2_018645 [Xanthoceras sorbifolium]
MLKPVMSLLFFFFLLFCSLNLQVTLATAADLKAKENPFTPKAYLTRYWNKKINNNLPKSPFLVSKASPLKAVDVASFVKLAAAQNKPPSLFPGISFNVYGPYEDIGKNDINFMTYGGNSNESSTQTSEDPEPSTNSLVNKKKLVTKKMEFSDHSVEPGKYFRESRLKQGTVMPMPNIKDKMPKRSFLPRSVVSKLPFSSSKLSAIKEVFHASDNSALECIIKEALKDCERKPNQGETKRCVGSAEDMIDFATSVLGRDVTLRKTENNKGAMQKILIGSVKAVSGGKATKPVSCHQKLYPYLLYYCHSVPKVRVYKADILDPKTKKKINHGVAICHLDTSTWSAGHEAFQALGSGPGRIEVCHWIFENDLIWTIADH